jgi:hypothetical protein
MNRNSVNSNKTSLFYFSILLAGVLGIVVNPAFAKSGTPDMLIAESTAIKIQGHKMIAPAKVEAEPVSERMLAWFWDDSKGDEDVPKETPEPKAVETPEPTPTPQAPKMEMTEPKATIEMQKMEMTEPKATIEMQKTVPVAPTENPVMEATPSKEETIPETPAMAKPDAVETPEQKVVPEVVQEKKVIEVAPAPPVEQAKPAMKKQDAPAEVKVTSTGFYKGAKSCEECHEGEFKIWKGTKHHTSFRTAHREPKDSAKPSPKKILKNVAGAKRMKRNKTCYLCHYTLQQKSADAKLVAKSGTSCENCHGASSEWLAIHDNYGGEGIMRMDETPQHKKERIEQSAAKGLIWPAMKYQVVENCMSCHGLAHPDLSGDVLAKMLGAGHPINPDFEAVKYSQGTVRHRYTPDDITNNREMTEAEKAELFVIGHAAALVSAREAMSKSNEPKYTDAQNKRAENAEAVLSLLSDIPEAAELMADPTRQNALNLVNALNGKDLTGKVGSMLPAKDDYK